MKPSKWRGWHLGKGTFDDKQRQKPQRASKGFPNWSRGAASPARTLAGEELERRRAELEVAGAPDSP